MNELAGSVGSFTTSTNFALCNIMHGETESMVKATHLLLYIKNAGVELGYQDIPETVLVEGDNQAAINWVYGGATSNLSRHFTQRIMAIRDYGARGIAEYVHIPTDKNVSDLGTKAMGPGLFNTHARNIQGHRLLDKLPIKIKGVRDISVPVAEDLVEIINCLAIDSGMGTDFDLLVLSELLQMLDEEQMVQEINWTVNDYTLAHAYLFRLEDPSAEEQPLLMATTGEGTAPDMSFMTR
jgi:hypothetical protein